MNAPVSWRLLCVAGDAVVEQPALQAQAVAQEREVRRVVLHPDVLGQPDRGDRVEAGLGDLAVVAVPHLGEVVEAHLLDPLLRPRRLLARQRHAERLDAVVLGRVADHPAPAAADVEQPHARAAGRACWRPGRTCRTAPARASRRRSGRPRRCRSSTGRGRARRTRWTRRSGGGSPRRRACASGARPRRPAASAAGAPAGGGGGGLRWERPSPRTSRTASVGDGQRNLRPFCSAFSAS